MTLNNDRYTYRVTWSEDDKECVDLCAEFPSLSWLARTHEAALRGIRKVVGEAVKDMQEQGEAVPGPIASRHYSGKFTQILRKFSRYGRGQVVRKGFSPNLP